MEERAKNFKIKILPAPTRKLNTTSGRTIMKEKCNCRDRQLPFIQCSFATLKKTGIFLVNSINAKFLWKFSNWTMKSTAEKTRNEEDMINFKLSYKITILLDPSRALHPVVRPTDSRLNYIEQQRTLINEAKWIKLENLQKIVCLLKIVKNELNLKTIVDRFEITETIGMDPFLFVFL